MGFTKGVIVQKSFFYARLPPGIKKGVIYSKKGKIFKKKKRHNIEATSFVIKMYPKNEK